MIRLEQRGAVGVIWLARPDQRNALTPEMLHRISTGAGELSCTSRAIVLAGEGPVFCSGFDLTLCRDDPGGTAMRRLLIGLSAAIRLLRGLALPVVAAAQGAAIAGGCALLGGCDVVVTDAGAKFGYPVLRIGVSPAVSAPFLAEAIGEGLARARLLDTGLISGQDAVRLGLAHELVGEAAAVQARAVEIASRMAAFPLLGITRTKPWLNEVSEARQGGEAASMGLRVSLGLVGGEEERRLLPAALNKGKP